MPFRPFGGQNCSVAEALAVVGERWTLLIVRDVLLGRRRFADIRAGTGVATNILSDRLQTLVAHGILRRERHGEHPDVFEYVPTRKAVDLWPVIASLLAWGDRYAAPAGAPRVLVHTTCGHDADPHLHCAHCGDELDPRHVATRPGPGADEAQRAAGVLPASARRA